MATLGFDGAYAAGTPPWDIGRPQPAIEQLADAGAIRGAVLDVGCGTGEHALMAAALGLRAVGLDASPRAIEQAQRKAAERDLDARFVLGDALDLEGTLGEAFDTVIDSGLFHIFDDADRARYVESLGRVVAPRGRVFVLCFSDRAPGTIGPRRIRENELRASFDDGWVVADVELVNMAVLFASDAIPAWLATIERT